MLFSVVFAKSSLQIIGISHIKLVDRLAIYYVDSITHLVEIKKAAKE